MAKLAPKEAKLASKMAKLALQMAKFARRMAKLAQVACPKCTQKRQLAKIVKTSIFHWFSLVFPGLEGLGGTWETLWGTSRRPWETFWEALEDLRRPEGCL